MADRSDPLILDALGRAAAEPDGLALHSGKAAPGLFPATAAGRLAAQACRERGYLRPLRTESRGKSVQDICAITEQGLAHLLSEVNPRQVLETLVRAVNERRDQLAELTRTAEHTCAGLDALRATAEKVLSELRERPAPPLPLPPDRSQAAPNGSDAWTGAVLTLLDARRSALEDCPLPELYRVARQAQPSLSIGRFHDGLRKLHEQEKIYLHPWTGPLYELPEPALALLVGHEVAYYASVRT